MIKNEQIERLKNKLYENFNKFYDEEILKDVKNLIAIITLSNESVRKIYSNVLLDCYKFMCETEYLSKSYEKCLGYIKKIKYLQSYKKESIDTINHVKIREFQCKIMLDIYNDDIGSIKKEQKFIEQFKEEQGSSLVKTLKEDLDKLIDLVDSYINNQIKTTINFQLPYKIDISSTQAIKYKYKETLFVLRFETVQEDTKKLIPVFCENGIVELNQDRYGIASRSNLSLTFNKFFDATHDMEGLIRFSSEGFNYFLEYYRMTTQQYWIDNLNMSQIHASNVIVFGRCYNFIEIPFYYNQNLRIQSEASYISSEILEQLKYELTNAQDIPLWKKLYLDALNYMSIEKYREALLSINSSFENYLNIKSREILNTSMSSEEVEEYLKGSISYDNFYMNQYVNKEQFDDAVKKGLIVPYAPNTFQIVSKCIENDNEHRILKSKTALKKMIGKIRKNRNDIIHGNISEISNIKSDVTESIKAFDVFVENFK